MAKEVYEYSPKHSQEKYHMQTDDTEYIYPNIRSCIAIGFTNKAGDKFYAVHFSTATRDNQTELITAIRIMGIIMGRNGGNIYMVGPYTEVWKQSNLLPELKKISRSIFVADIQKANNSRNIGADVDVKMTLTGKQVKGFIKPLGGALYVIVDFKPIS